MDVSGTPDVETAESSATTSGTNTEWSGSVVATLAPTVIGSSAAARLSTAPDNTVGPIGSALAAAEKSATPGVGAEPIGLSPIEDPREET